MPNTDKWLAIEDYNDMVAEQLQKKIAEDLYLYESKEFDKWLDKVEEQPIINDKTLNYDFKNRRHHSFSFIYSSAFIRSV